MSVENPDMHRIVGTHDVVMVTLDTLRYDVAQEQFRAGRLPHLAAYLPDSGWELRHTPGTFAARGPSFVIICSDHGTAYGEDGYWGHRHGHPVVLDVPYAHFEIPAAGKDR